MKVGTGIKHPILKTSLISNKCTMFNQLVNMFIFPIDDINKSKFAINRCYGPVKKTKLNLGQHYFSKLASVL